MWRLRVFWGNLAESAGLMDPGAPGELRSGANSSPFGTEGPLLHHLIHVRAQQAEHQRVDQNAHLGRLALSVGDHGADHGQHARQVIGHGVRNQEEQSEASNVRHLLVL